MGRRAGLWQGRAIYAFDDAPRRFPRFDATWFALRIIV
jgi:hypothetical protein